MAYVQTTILPAAGGNSPFSFTAFGAAIGSGNAIGGFVFWFSTGTPTITGITDDKGNTYTVGTRITDGGGLWFAQPFYRGNITNAPTIITVTTSPVNITNAIAGICSEYSSIVALTNPTDGVVGQFQLTPGTGTDAITSSSVTTTANGDTILGFGVSTAGNTLTAGTGFTTRGSGGLTGVLSEDLVQSSAGSIAATFTQGVAGETAAFIIALKAAAIAAPFVSNNTSLPFGPGAAPPPMLAGSSQALTMSTPAVLPLMGAICM